ncbi:cyclase family protein [Aureimonas altamirensis]|uniref:cyclase family protein n=1 Tax=Aureimonas altamirensis TaxID=370622 RepID=UPI001E35A5FE|nr:cyclase family protein [Aureimonas altamirensis]UHD46431.1 cyclase family protein [Aureimonas altamirensis]
MEFIDLSRELHHRAPSLPNHPPQLMTVWIDHDVEEQAGDVSTSFKMLTLAIGDHSGTHVDAPAHFDARPEALSIDKVPLERFYTEAFCIDLSHLDLKQAATADEVRAAVKATDQTIKQGDTLLIYMATNDRLFGRPEYLTDFPGLSPEAVAWLADQGIGMFGVEAVSPAPTGALNYRAHQVCAERGITHMECLFNLDKLIGRGRFRFAGFPLRIRGGTGSPIRAVAIFE